MVFVNGQRWKQYPPDLFHISGYRLQNSTVRQMETKHGCLECPVPEMKASITLCLMKPKFGGMKMEGLI
jgi:hypothetical protein